MFNNILVAIDESEMNHKILDATLNIAKNNQSFVTLVNVNKAHITRGLTYVPKDYLEESFNQLEKESMKKLEEAKSKLVKSNSDITIKKVPLKGDPAQQILEYAEKNNQNLIIMGSRGLSRIKGVMLGSVSHKVTQLSQCPVLIVH